MVVGLLILVLLLGGVLAWGIPTLLEQKRVNPEPTTNPLATPVACADHMVQITPAVPSSGLAGQPVKVDFTVTTTSEQPCLIDVGPGRVGVIITSGNQTIINTLECAGVEPEPHKLLMKAGETWKGAITWDGVVRGAGCAPLDKATAGTYVVRLLRGEQAAGEQNVLVLE